MPETTAHETEEVPKLEILDKDGEVDEELEPDLDDETLLEMYRDLIYARKFDRKAFKLQRRGDSGTYAPHKGQEACQIGPAYAMEESDWMVPSFREGAMALARGVDPAQLIRYFMGDSSGNKVGDSHNFPVSIPVGSQILHAAGLGMGANILGEDEAVITYFGDGATSQGDFHGGLNFAGVFNAPVVFFNQNNQYAISVPREKQTRSETLAQKALAYGFKGIQVDGNDILATYVATKNALERAKNGEGPTLIEGITYRLGVHTTSDDPSRYREEEEEKEWEEKDPITRFETYLKDKGILDEDKIEEIKEEMQEKVDSAAEEALEMEDPGPEEMFKHVYDEMPPRLEKQLSSLKEIENSGGDG
ncbi:MAG: pyruvate dehydrogenase (acetyl-transferring) E1 component subunit alpha [Candidatus Nanohaloarchaea archaeon]|nr:pyruvate dehydrogenase (acetyl-transferring) E1 component subunit alpha [Candidatus Nanohaloarchaea archaeon]